MITSGADDENDASILRQQQQQLLSVPVAFAMENGLTNPASQHCDPMVDNIQPKILGQIRVVNSNNSDDSSIKTSGSYAYVIDKPVGWAILGSNNKSQSSLIRGTKDNNKNNNNKKKKKASSTMTMPVRAARRLLTLTSTTKCSSGRTARRASGHCACMRAVSPPTSWAPSRVRGPSATLRQSVSKRTTCLIPVIRHL